MPPGKTTIVVNASITYDSVTGAAAFGRLAGRNMEKMPLKVDVRSQIPIVLFLFPFPIYFIFPDGKYFIKKLKKNEKSEGAAREWSTVVIVTVIFIS